MKKAYFYIDDTIWVMRDIARQKPASLFDNPFMNMLKTAHDRYGVKTQLNMFYRTDYFYGNDEFTLSEMNIYERTKIISGFVSSEFSGIELIPVISSKKMMAGDVDEAIRALSELGYTKYIIE